MPPKVSPIDSHAGYWLRCVSNHVSQAFATKVEAHGVTVAEWVVLRSLFDVDEMNPSALADLIGHTRGTVSKLIDRLAAKGLVLCRTEGADRRFQLVCLTPQGRALVPILADLADQNDREFFGDSADPACAALVASLKDICRRHGWKSAPVR
jgi:DNA-binding MarR family transcriptional regulator